MHYRSIADLNDCLVQNVHKIPPDIDLIVGVPRSGLLAATMLSLILNIPFTDVEGFIEGRLIATGKTRATKINIKSAYDAKHVIVLEDSAYSGISLLKAKERISDRNLAMKITYCAVYGLKKQYSGCDIILEVVPTPRMFQWNYMHHSNLSKCCVDIDGVLCKDPTSIQNDDGKAYIEFLNNPVPLYIPSVKIGKIVTSRLEKYRKETEAWLKRVGIIYDELIMLDYPTAEARRAANSHASFKAEVYKKSDAILFIESEFLQACEIAKRSGKHVMCVETQHIITPDLSMLSLVQQTKMLPARLRYGTSGNSLRTMFKYALGQKGYEILKAVFKR